MISNPALAHEPWIRLGAFSLVFLGMALWEALWPRRKQTFGRGARWPHNIGLLLIDIATARFVAPGAAIAVAQTAATHEWGLLHTFVPPSWAAVVLAVTLLDLTIYFQHVMFHAVPTLWRLHRVHHTDLDFDLTTGIRFHPVEILLSSGIKCAAIAAIGAPVIAVVVFEVLLNGTTLFNHANARLPRILERFLRWIVVTPDMHRVHHSIIYNETNSNFGFNLPWWDRMFGTYRAQPAGRHEAMTIGVDAFRRREDLRLDHLLVQPFRETAGGYAINRRPDSADAVQTG
jgi:sterol desaturase/sphingolipid hydroxylase (fatty acid hydroxylase superfamily)